ncbi:fatty acid desaturase [Nostoc sp. LEGE 06077]|uniref:fatty acid desaturase n=1 Tax=Nostoc sp. LEGE 06077 TaxID=915325 RepID=UPI0018804792|nr:fatty acid desaturase [Nostoc sp. LEGE 06077]MBE9207050.1 fatty acid desaturase [Nostoc sp. LEGE 06077]
MVTTVKFVAQNTYFEQQKPLWNTIAIVYTFLGYIGGITLLIIPTIWLNLFGVVLLTHSLVFSAYLSHEFMHSTIFKQRRWNVIFGTAMLWLNGGCYYGFQALTLQHIAHHLDRVDVFIFDIIAAIQKLPRLVRLGILVLEWLYFPILAFWMRWRYITSPWWNLEHRQERSRMILILAIRGTLFILLGLFAFKALLLYSFSYIGMITVLRWMDTFQHTYEAFPPGATLPKRDHNYEQANTFSNLLSRRYFWLNLLLLNFGYHNTHHAVMTCPWHSLHQLDQELFHHHEKHYIPLLTQLINYHRFRITRLLTGMGQVVDENDSLNLEHFYGAIEVSFLTLY